MFLYTVLTINIKFISKINNIWKKCIMVTFKSFQMPEFPVINLIQDMQNSLQTKLLGMKY